MAFGDPPVTIADALTLLTRELQVEIFADPEPRGVRIHLPNGWKVSVALGRGSYVTVAGDRALRAEVAIFRPDETWLVHQDETGPVQFSEVWGWISPTDLLRVVDAVSQAHRTARCPCPDCVLKPEGVYVARP
jgi:hypothetical protein